MPTNTPDAVGEVLQCPFCGDDDFDTVGLCLHLSGGCAHYDRACRQTSDELERRAAQHEWSLRWAIGGFDMVARQCKCCGKRLNG